MNESIEKPKKLTKEEINSRITEILANYIGEEKTNWYYAKLVQEGGFEPDIAQLLIDSYKDFIITNRSSFTGKTPTSMIATFTYLFGVAYEKSGKPDDFAKFVALNQIQAGKLLGSTDMTIRKTTAKKVGNMMIRHILKDLTEQGYSPPSKISTYKRTAKLPPKLSVLLSDFTDDSEIINIVNKVLDDSEYYQWNYEISHNINRNIKNKYKNTDHFILPWKSVLGVCIALIAADIGERDLKIKPSSLGILKEQIREIYNKTDIVFRIIERVCMALNVSEEDADMFINYYEKQKLKYFQKLYK